MLVKKRIWFFALLLVVMSFMRPTLYVVMYHMAYRNIDFVIPSPTDEQIEALEGKNGIGVIIPYYMEKTDVGTVIILPDAKMVKYMPCPMITAKEAVVDWTYGEHKGIGSEMTLNVSSHRYAFVVRGHAYNNVFMAPSVAICVLAGDQARELKEEGLVYSAAYVQATDKEACKKYLLEEYKPYGRMKQPKDFVSVETYQKHVENFMSANWSKEITITREHLPRMFDSTWRKQLWQGLGMDICVCILLACLSMRHYENRI